MADLDGFSFFRRKGHLVPSDSRADDLMETISEGREIMVSLRKARNPRHHRLFFAMLHIVVQNDPQSRWLDEESLLDDLKRRVGYSYPILNGFTGIIEFRTKSISFSAMDQERFRVFFDRCCHVLATEILHMAPQALVDEVFAIVDGDASKAHRLAA